MRQITERVETVAGTGPLWALLTSVATFVTVAGIALLALRGV